jgi:hypothetical protein
VSQPIADIPERLFAPLAQRRTRRSRLEVHPFLCAAGFEPDHRPCGLPRALFIALTTTKTTKLQIPERETKERKTFTMTPSAIALLTRGSRSKGMSESTYVEQAVREKFERENTE